MRVSARSKLCSRQGSSNRGARPLVLASLFLTSLSCSKPDMPVIAPGVRVAAGDARLTPRDAIRISKDFAAARGIDLADYELTRVSYSTGRGSEEWWVLYDGIDPIPGNHFGLKIDDATGDVELFGGA